MYWYPTCTYGYGERLSVLKVIRPSMASTDAWCDHRSRIFLVVNIEFLTEFDFCHIRTKYDYTMLGEKSCKCVVLFFEIRVENCSLVIVEIHQR